MRSLAPGAQGCRLLLRALPENKHGVVTLAFGFALGGNPTPQTFALHFTVRKPPNVNLGKSLNESY